MKFGIKQAFSWAFALATVSAAIELGVAEKPWSMVRGPALAQVFADQDCGDGVPIYEALTPGRFQGFT